MVDGVSIRPVRVSWVDRHVPARTGALDLNVVVAVELDRPAPGQRSTASGMSVRILNPRVDVAFLPVRRFRGKGF